MLDSELDKDCIVADVRTGTKLFQRQETGIAETDSASRVRACRVPGRPLELLAAGTRHKTLHDVLALLSVLIAENDRDGQSERPVEQGVIVAGDDAYVNGQVSALARAGSTGKQRRSQTISVRRCVERSAFDLVDRKHTHNIQLHHHTPQSLNEKFSCCRDSARRHNSH